MTDREPNARAARHSAPKVKAARKSDQAFRTISEVAGELDLPQHVLRFWETKFTQISPMKRGGGRRYYRPEDVELLRTIKSLLHFDGYTIKGVQKLLSQGGVKSLLAAPKDGPSATTAQHDLALMSAAEPSEGVFQDSSEDVSGNIDLSGLAALVGELEEISDLLKKSIT